MVTQKVLESIFGQRNALIDLNQHLIIFPHDGADDEESFGPENYSFSPEDSSLELVFRTNYHGVKDSSSIVLFPGDPDGNCRKVLEASQRCSGNYRSFERVFHLDGNNSGN